MKAIKRETAQEFSTFDALEKLIECAQPHCIFLRYRLDFLGRELRNPALKVRFPEMSSMGLVLHESCHQRRLFWSRDESNAWRIRATK